MQIDVTLTREDWYAYARFIGARMGQHRRRWWAVSSWSPLRSESRSLTSAGFGVGISHAGSALLAIALMYAAIWLSAYLMRRFTPIPDAWIGPKRYVLGVEGLTVQGAMSLARYEWPAIRAVEETDGQLLLMLDGLSGLVIPKRYLSGAVDVESVKSELARLRTSVRATGAVSCGCSSPSLSHSAEQPGPAAVSRPFLSNVIAGLRLLAFRKVDASAVVPSARQVLLFTSIAALIWIAYDRLGAGEEAFFAQYALAQLGWLTLVAFALFVLFTPTSHGAAVLGRSSIAAASMLPLLTVLALAAEHFAQDTPVARWLGLLIAAVAAIYLFRAKRSVGNEPTISALVGSVAIVLIMVWVYGATVMMRPQFWYSGDDSEEDALDWSGAEEQIYRQPELLERRARGSARPGSRSGRRVFPRVRRRWRPGTVFQGGRGLRAMLWHSASTFASIR